MDKIGNLLKQRRLELGITVEEVSEKTRLTTKHIKAIEDGDISYFKDDLSYLRFFLKAYCEVLDLDFEPIREELRHSIDDYTTSFDQEAIRQHEEIEKGIQETNERLQQPKQKPVKRTVKKTRHHRKVDMSLLSFLAIVLVILIALITAFVLWIQKDHASPEDLNANKPPVATAPDGESDENKEPVKKEEEKKEMSITKQSDDSGNAVYTIENLKESDEIDVEITFGSNSSFRALVDDKELADPAKQVYSYKTVLHIREKAVPGKKIQLAFGFMLKNTIKVNGKDLEIPETLLNKSGSALIELNVKGE